MSNLVQEMIPVIAPVVGSIRPPGSKSLTNRALAIAALADGVTTLTGVLDSQDTQVMLESLRRLGFEVQTHLSSSKVTIEGLGGKIPAAEANLWLENSGTSIRFLTALCTLGHGTYRLDGNARMQQRPIKDLLDSLNEVGVKIRSELGTGCPPVVMETQGLPGGPATIAANTSSQFLSALLIAAPYAAQPMTLRLAGEMVSEPYVEMTLGVMRAFGVHAVRENGVYRVGQGVYRSGNYAIEPDASAASYYFAAAAITGGRISVEGLHRHALQGDVQFVNALEQMGCEVIHEADRITVQGKPLRGIDIDMNGISDTAQTLAAVAPFAVGPTRIRNIAHVRHKETDRIGAVVTELRRLGVAAEEHDDGMTIVPGPVSAGEVQTYDDHRMAMSFALLGLRVPGIRILDPGCTGKTYPHFFTDLDRLCAPFRAGWSTGASHS